MEGERPKHNSNVDRLFPGAQCVDFEHQAENWTVTGSFRDPIKRPSIRERYLNKTRVAELEARASGPFAENREFISVTIAGIGFYVMGQMAYKRLTKKRPS